MSFDNQESMMTIRGKDFPIITLPANSDATQKVMQALILALYAIDDPRVDKVLKAFKIQFIWPYGHKTTPLFEEDE